MIKKIFKSLTLWIFVGLVLGGISGIFLTKDSYMFEPLTDIGNIFINLIKMLVIPLIVFSIVSGASSLGRSSHAGRVGIITFAFIFLTSILAVSLALYMGHIFKPGEGLDLKDVAHMFSNKYADKGHMLGFWQTILSFIPSNVIVAMFKGHILQVLFFCIFFGFGLNKIKKEQARPIINSVDGILNALIWMIGIVMMTAPIGVFALTASSIANYGFAKLTSIFDLFLVYVGAIIIYGWIVYPVLVKIFSKTSPFKFISKIKEAQIVAFSTDSSMATLPVTMEVTEKELGVSNDVASFVLPLGATINMTGNAIYYGLVAMFFAQFYNIDIGWHEYVIIALTSTLGAIGQAGIPGPSFLVITVLVAAGIPIQGIPLLFALDRIFDMIRTVLNITGDSACAVIVDYYNKK